MQSTEIFSSVKVIIPDLKSMNSKIPVVDWVGSAYEMKQPGMCIVSIQWLN
jgi:hypothetical protein